MIKLINILLFFYILELSIYANNISTYLHESPVVIFAHFFHILEFFFMEREVGGILEGGR